MLNSVETPIFPSAMLFVTMEHSLQQIIKFKLYVQSRSKTSSRIVAFNAKTQSINPKKTSIVSTKLERQRLCQARPALDFTDLSGKRVAVEGDVVTVHFTVYGEDGSKLESSEDAGQPLSFEVGSEKFIDSELLQALDGGVRGLAVGAKRDIELANLQEDWTPELLFTVPKSHQEVTRLEGKFGSSGGLSEGMIVELANGSQAQIVKITSENIVFDANSAFAGRKVVFSLELLGIEAK